MSPAGGHLAGRLSRRFARSGRIVFSTIVQIRARQVMDQYNALYRLRYWLFRMRRMLFRLLYMLNRPYFGVDEPTREPHDDDEAIAAVPFGIAMNLVALAIMASLVVYCRPNTYIYPTVNVLLVTVAWLCSVSIGGTRGIAEIREANRRGNRRQVRISAIGLLLNCATILTGLLTLRILATVMGWTIRP